MIAKISPDGTVTRLVDVPGRHNGHITYHAGALWVAAKVAQELYRVSLDGALTLIAGTGERGNTSGPALQQNLLCVLEGDA